MTDVCIVVSMESVFSFSFCKWFVFRYDMLSTEGVVTIARLEVFSSAESSQSKLK